MFRHPSYFSAISWIVYVDGMKRLLKNLMHPGKKEDFTQAYVTLRQKPLANCTLVDLAARPADPAWVHYLRSHYADAADRVILDVTPTPACNPLYPAWTEDLQGLTDNHLETYPPPLFVDGVHFDRAGAIRYSEEMANQILGFEHRTSSARTPAQQAVDPGAR